MRLKNFLEDKYSVGKGAVKLPIGGIIQGYRDRYKTIEGSIKAETYYVQPAGKTIVHFKIPSETVDDFFYDVLLELSRSGGADRFEECHVKFFSNCPSFVFTYAHLFYTMKDPEINSDSMIIDKFNQKIPKERLMIKGTEKKLSDQALTDKAVVRNPLGLVLPDKSIYYAIFYLLDHMSFHDVMYSRRYISMMYLLRSVESFDNLMLMRRSQNAKNKEKRERENRDTVRSFKRRERELNATSKVAPVKKVAAVQKRQPIKPINRRK